MPTNLTEAQTGGLNLLFADDLKGTEFRLREAAVYDAEEVREDLDGDVPEFGRWFPVETADGEGYALAPGEFIQELQRLEAEEGEIFTVTRCEKSGGGETDPYEVNVERLSEDDQTRL